MVEKKKNRKKVIFDGIFLMTVFGLTMYGVFKGEDLPAILGYIRGTKDSYLVLAMLCVVFFVYSESAIIYKLLCSLGVRLSRGKCFLISNVGFFFSCITPSASGGQPMQVLYLRKEKVSVPVSTLVLMIVTIMYKSVLVVTGIGIMVFGRRFMHTYLEDVLGVFYLGIFLNIICVAGMGILAFHPTLARRMGEKILKFLGKIHVIKNTEDWEGRLEVSMDSYSQVAAFLGNHTGLMARVLLVTIVQRLALFLVTYFVYKSFGLAGYGVQTIVLLQAAISIAVDMLPLPGGMGISEKLFLVIFGPVFGTKLIVPGMVLARGLGYYIQLLMCAVLTGVAHFVLGKERNSGC